MTDLRKIMLPAIGAALLAWVLWAMVNAVWLKPRAQLIERLERSTTGVNDAQRVLDNRARLIANLDAVIDRTLGSDVESVDHRLRTRLNRIAEQVPLSGATVSTGRPAARTSPARLAFPRDMRNEIDFVEVEGSISAEGTLGQIINLVDRIEAEPWIKRISFMRLDPKGNGERFSLTLRLTTIFLPGRDPEDLPPTPYDEQRMARYAALMHGNPFRVPPPPPPETAQASAPVPPPPPPPVVERWTVTGIAQGPAGAETWLKNLRSGESRRLAVGDRVADAEFVAVNGQEAEFQVDQQRLVVGIGDVISERDGRVRRQ